MHQTLARQVTEGTMDRFEVNNLGQFDTVQFTTRYFTSHRDDPLGTAIPFDRSMDPKGVVATMLNDSFFHGEDNQVLYYMLKYSDDDSIPQ